MEYVSQVAGMLDTHTAVTELVCYIRLQAGTSGMFILARFSNKKLHFGISYYKMGVKWTRKASVM